MRAHQPCPASVDRRLAAYKRKQGRKIYGKTKHHEKLLHKFDHNPKCRCMILQNSGGFGLNLQVANYCLFFESPVSPIVRTQTERRVERQGSLHKRVFRYDLMVAGTFDKRIRTALQAGEDLFQAIIRGKSSPTKQIERSLRGSAPSSASKA